MELNAYLDKLEQLEKHAVEVDDMSELCDSIPKLIEMIRLLTDGGMSFGFKEELERILKDET